MARDDDDSASMASAIKSARVDVAATCPTWKDKYLVSFMYTLICGSVDVHGHDVYLFFWLMNLHKKGCWGFLL